mgnify:CR=1 FL=1|tara:strand:- start:626 stop:1675 length:1050 start_codon:yes stop_codon:yes gene_type:complete
MDYINYVKQAPFAGFAGFGGGATGLAFKSSAPFEKPDGYYWGGDRGLAFGGYDAPSTVMNEIQYFGISTLTSGSDFGDMTGTARYAGAGASNGTRGLYAGGYEDPSYSNVIDYVTIANTGNATDFGDCLTTYTWGMQGVAGNPTGGASNANRGLFAGGYNPINDVIQYVDITSTGNSTDFGDMIYKRRQFGAVSNGSRAVWAGGYSMPQPAFTFRANMDYTTIATTGNATDFGDLLTASEGQTGCSSKTRGVFSGGLIPASPWYGALQAITIDTTANATSIGTQNSSTRGQAAASSNGVYGTWVGGKAATSEISSMTYISIDTHSSGLVSNFGSLTSARTFCAGASGDV